MSIRSIIPVFVAFLVLAGSSLASPEGARILKEVDAIRGPSESFTFQTTVAVADGQQVVLNVFVKDYAKSLVRYLLPPKSKGRSLLFSGRNMWVYIPGTRRSLRISPQQRVLGGVASADIARTSYSYDYAVSEIQKIDGKRQKLKLSARNSKVAYARIDLTVAIADSRPIQAEFFSANGKRKLKTAYFQKYAQMLERERPTLLKIIDHQNGDEITRIAYSHMKLKNLPSAWFQPAYLSKLK